MTADSGVDREQRFSLSLSPAGLQIVNNAAWALHAALFVLKRPAFEVMIDVVKCQQVRPRCFRNTPMVRSIDS